MPRPPQPPSLAAAARGGRLAAARPPCARQRQAPGCARDTLAGAQGPGVPLSIPKTGPAGPISHSCSTRCPACPLRRRTGSPRAKPGLPLPSQPSSHQVQTAPHRHGCLLRRAPPGHAAWPWRALLRGCPSCHHGVVQHPVQLPGGLPAPSLTFASLHGWLGPVASAPGQAVAQRLGASSCCQTPPNPNQRRVFPWTLPTRSAPLTWC